MNIRFSLWIFLIYYLVSLFHFFSIIIFFNSISNFKAFMLFEKLYVIWKKCNSWTESENWWKVKKNTNKHNLYLWLNVDNTNITLLIVTDSIIYHCIFLLFPFIIRWDRGTIYLQHLFCFCVWLAGHSRIPIGVSQFGKFLLRPLWIHCEFKLQTVYFKVKCL